MVVSNKKYLEIENKDPTLIAKGKLDKNTINFIVYANHREGNYHLIMNGCKPILFGDISHIEVFLTGLKLGLPKQYSYMGDYSFEISKNDIVKINLTKTIDNP